MLLRRFAADQQGRWALFLPILAMAGDALFFALRRDPPVLAAPVLLVLATLAALPRRPPALHAVALALAFAAFGFASAQFATWRAPPFPALPRRAALVIGTIATADTLPDRTRLLLSHPSIDGVPQPRALRLSAPPDPALQPGAIIAARALLSPPALPQLPGGQDPQRQAFFAGIGGSGRVLHQPRILAPAPPSGLQRLRAAIAARIHLVLPDADGAIAATLLTGLSAAIPQNDRDAFRDSGLAHLLAIAGLHLGIVMGLALAVSRTALLRSEWITLRLPVANLAAIASLVAGLLYLLLTGLHVPTLRSFIMAALVVLALLVGRRAASLRGWGLAALAIIALSPAEIVAPGFQLSFAAVLALICGYQWLNPALSRLHGRSRIAHHLATLALTSLFAGLASLPFIAHHFGRIELYFVAANLVAVPVAAFATMPLGLLSLAAMPFGLDAWPLRAMGATIGLIRAIARFVAGLPGAVIATPHVSTTALIAMASGLALLCLWAGPWRLGGLLPILAGIALAATARPPDIVISADSRLIGLRSGATLLLVAQRGGNDAALRDWQAALDLATRPLGLDPAASCTDRSCRVLLGATAIRIGPGGPCDASIRITQSGAPRICPGALSIARASTWHDGALAITLHPAAGQPVSVHLRSDHASRGDRPGVFLPPAQERAGIDLPFAPSEIAPP